MLTTRVVKMRYLRNVFDLGDNLWSNYYMRTLNAREEMRYKSINSVHIGVKLLYDHGRARDRDATQ